MLILSCRRAELRERSEEEHARDTEEKKQAFNEFQAKLGEVKGKDVKELDPEVERRYAPLCPFLSPPSTCPLSSLLFCIFGLIVYTRRAELRERSEEEHARDAEEKKQAFSEFQAKLSEVKGKDVKELDADVERRYILFYPLLPLPLSLCSHHPPFLCSSRLILDQEG